MYPLSLVCIHVLPSIISHIFIASAILQINRIDGDENNFAELEIPHSLYWKVKEVQEGKVFWEAL